MNPLQYLTKHWDFKKTTEQNVISFNNGKEKAKKARRNLIIFSVVVIALSILFHNPMLCLALMIGALAFGSESTFSASGYDTNIALLDSTHIVVAYAYGSSYGRAIIGVISDGSITWGDPVNFVNVEITYPKVCALDSTHFAVSWRNAYAATPSMLASVIVGEVSNGDEIAFGTKQNYVTNPNQPYISALDSTHFVISWGDTSNSQRLTACIGVVTGKECVLGGTSYFAIYSGIKGMCALDATHFVVVVIDSADSSKGKAVMGVVSNGDEIAFGDAYIFNNAATDRVDCAKIDATHFVVVFVDSANSNYGTSIIGTTSNGDEIAFGSEYVFEAATTYQSVVLALDSTHIVIAYINSDGHGYAVVGTIENIDELSFDDPVEFNNASLSYLSITKISSSTFAISFRDNGDSDNGKVIIGTVSFVVAPTVTTQAVDQIDKTSVRGNGNITATGGANATRRGFCYKAGTSGDPTVADSTAYDDGDFGTGAYTKAITGLTKGTAYRVRAYAVNPAGTSYGTTVDYVTVNDVAKTKSLKYTIKTTPTAKTKGLIYKTRSTITSLTRSLKYTNITSSSVALGLQYSIWTYPTKILKYCVQKTDSLVKGLVYAIEGQTIQQKGLQYAILIIASAVKSLAYAIVKTPSVVKDLSYSIIKEKQSLKTLKYTIITSDSNTKSLGYFIIKIYSFPKALRYAIESKVITSKSLTYAIEVPKGIDIEVNLLATDIQIEMQSADIEVNLPGIDSSIDLI